MRVWLSRTVPWPGSAAGTNSETINRAADLYPGIRSPPAKQLRCASPWRAGFAIIIIIQNHWQIDRLEKKKKESERKKNRSTLSVCRLWRSRFLYFMGAAEGHVIASEQRLPDPPTRTPPSAPPTNAPTRYTGRWVRVPVSRWLARRKTRG